MGDHPWRRFRELADWLLGWAHLPGDTLGVTDYRAQVVVLDKRLTQAERRCTIAHELEHVRRGPYPDWAWAKEEAAVDRAAARRLIDIHHLAKAMAWSRDLHEVAEELWVDVPTLEARLRSLHPSERAYLERRLEHHEQAAH